MDPQEFLATIFRENCEKPGAWIFRQFILEEAGKLGGDELLVGVDQEIKLALENELLNAGEDNVGDRLELTDAGFAKYSNP